MEKDARSMRWLCWDARNRWEWFEEFAGSIRRVFARSISRER